MSHIDKTKIPQGSQPKKNSFIQGMFKKTSVGETENGAMTYTRTESALLDFFAQAGAMRNNLTGALDLFKKAFAEDNLKAIRILFYLRDIRGGQGERKLFREALEYLESNHKEILEAILQYVPEFGRWDDMFFNNPKAGEIMRKQIDEDLKTENPSLLAKWLPTANASSLLTRTKAKKMAEALGFKTTKEYRKTLRAIRKKIETVEEKMSGKDWDKIKYETVPSQASKIYRKAFAKHDEDRYNEFIEAAKKGKKKINAGTLYPYQIYNAVQRDYDQTLEALWKQLPDYTRGKNALVVADVSGSMSGNPMSVSVSLALYFAERNKGAFQNYFLTFSGNPVLQKITGKTLEEKMNSIEKADWQQNTDIEKTFELIKNVIIQNNVPEDERPETIYIISDMEFDVATGSGYSWHARNKQTNYEAIKESFEQANIKLPNLVFWNVNASGKNLPVEEDERGVTMISGFSPSVFKIAVENKTPIEVMLDVIESERYKIININ